MSKIINLSENIISRKDRDQMESFGAHVIGHGRATRWHWHKMDNGDLVFEIYQGGADEALVVCISRNRKSDSFYAHDATGSMVSSGVLAHVMADLDRYFIQLHGG